MSLSPRKISSVVLMLALVHLFAPAAHALPPSDQQGAFRYTDALTAVWEWLGLRLAPDHGKPRLQVIWEKAGSQMDPNGTPQNNVLASDVDHEGNK